MTSEELKDNNFSLVLSGGGALSISQITIIEKMEKYPLIPSEIIGTSMGGLIGACYSIGLDSKAISKLISEFARISNWAKFSFSGNGLLNTEKIEKIFEIIFNKRKMFETNIPLKLIATEFKTGKVKIFDKDSDVLIKDALLATIAIPGIFESKKINNIIYSDGFLVENLGINQADYNYVLAIDVLGEKSFNGNLPESFFKTKRCLEMMEKSMKILIINQTRSSFDKCDKNIFYIDIDTTGFRTFYFHRFEELIALCKDYKFNEGLEDV